MHTKAKHCALVSRFYCWVW